METLLAIGALLFLLDGATIPVYVVRRARPVVMQEKPLPTFVKVLLASVFIFGLLAIIWQWAVASAPWLLVMTAPGAMLVVRLTWQEETLFLAAAALLMAVFMAGMMGVVVLDRLAGRGQK